MTDLETIKRLNREQMDRVQYPRLHSIKPRLHPLVAASIRSVEEQRPLSEVQAEREADNDGPYDPTRAGGLFERLEDQSGE